jgi:hypothetical protein
MVLGGGTSTPLFWANVDVVISVGVSLIFVKREENPGPMGVPIVCANITLGAVGKYRGQKTDLATAPWD